VIAVDTSVVVAGLLLDHAQHHRAQPVLRSGPAIPAHAALESYSVLTRLPAPGRVSPAAAAQLLTRAFAGRYVALSVDEQEALVSELSRLGIMGGAVYDALIAATAMRHGLTLRTLDERAAATYDAIGVNFELL
jgi:predicted nucleic acid-binding protein